MTVASFLSILANSGATLLFQTVKLLMLIKHIRCAFTCKSTVSLHLMSKQGPHFTSVLSLELNGCKATSVNWWVTAPG